MAKKRTKELTETVENIEQGMDEEHPSVDNILERFSRRGFGALLLLPATLVVLPTGAIPGMPIVCGLLIILFSVQMLFGKSTPWVPKRIRSIEFKPKKISKVVDRIRPYTKKIDSYLYPRLSFVFHPALDRIYALIVMVLGITIIVFGFVPFAVMLPGLSMLLMALGLAVKDGALTIVGVIIFVGHVIAMPFLLSPLMS